MKTFFKIEHQIIGDYAGADVISRGAKLLQVGATGLGAMALAACSGAAHTGRKARASAHQARPPCQRKHQQPKPAPTSWATN